MKIILAGETFEYDNTKTPMSEALWVEHVYKRRFAEWQSDLSAGSAKAMCMLACLIWRRAGREDTAAAYQDLLDGKTDFDLLELLGSLADAVTEAEAEAEPGEAAAPDPTPSPAPAGTRTTRRSTKPSSPST